ncbi:MAG TPA: ABC transporter ATP-binding protein [Myxococcota bacterium]|nr:ABC transporter ATP-binding protein [Myxococcota bacterium]
MSDSVTRESTSSILSVLRRTLRYVAPVRGRFAVKIAFTFLSILPLLVLPVPIKLLLDHVIGDLPLADRIDSFPFLARPLLRLLVGASPGEILAWTVAAQALLLVAIGQIGTDGGERDRTEGYLSAGVDTATETENAANAGFSFVGGVFGFCDFAWTLRLSQDLNHHFRSRLFERIQSLPLGTLDDERIGDALYRLMYDTPSITGACYRIVLVLAVAPLGVALYAFAIWDSLRVPSLAYYALGLGALVLAATWPFAELVRRRGARSRSAGSVTTASLEEGVSNMLAVQSLGAESRERARFDRDSRGSFDRHRGVIALAMAAIFCAIVPSVFLVRAAFLEVVDLVISGRLSLGDFSLLVTYFVQVCVFCVYLGGLWFAVHLAAPGLDRVFHLMDQEPERDAPGARELAPVRECLRFEDVAFEHAAGAATLSGVSFEAKLGELTAIVGPAGAGKTTLVQHVPRFLQPSAGRVLVDGVDVACVTRASLRAQIAFVFQETSLFAGTLEDNLRLAKPDATELELRRAAQLAGVDEFVRALPDGWGTVLGRGGAGLSVGQKQRLAIARALLRDAAILILDEPTSALDPDTESRVLGALRHAVRDRIVLLVSHRLSAVREADQILFLREGRIEERGTHAELVALPGGAYRRFVELQATG